MDTPYYTKSEDGTFRPVTLTTTTLGEMIAQYATGHIKLIVANQLESIISAAFSSMDIEGKAREIVENLDLHSEIDQAIDDVDVQDMVREEIQGRIESMDISVDVSI